MPLLKKDPSAKKRFGVYYFKLADDNPRAVKQDTSGSTNDLERAFGHAASHCAKSELNRHEYAKALVIDRHKGKFLRVYTKRENEITIKKYE